MRIRLDDVIIGAIVWVVVVLLIVSASCGCIIKKVDVVPHPLAPVMVTEVRRRYIRGAVYSKAQNKLIDAGWMRINREGLVGKTLTTFDWEAHIEKRNRDGE